MTSTLLLALDPSSTRTGYALLRAAGDVAEAGYLSGRRNKGVIERICIQLADLAELFCDFPAISHAAIEVPLGKVFQRNGGKGAGLAVYGVAVGAIWHATVQSLHGVVDTVDEKTWTRSIPKAKRRDRIAAEFPEYRQHFTKDSGGDVADAIGIGQWWFAGQRRRMALAAGDNGDGQRQ